MKRKLLPFGFSILFLGLFTSSAHTNAQSLVPMSFATNSAKTVHRQSMLETISTSGRSGLTQLIMKAGLIAPLSGKTDYTFFAPSNAAIATLVDLPADKLHGILMNHLVVGRYATNDLKEGTKLRTLGGDPITIIRKGDTILISGIAIVQANEPADNGIIHTLSGSLY